MLDRVFESPGNPVEEQVVGRPLVLVEPEVADAQVQDLLEEARLERVAGEKPEVRHLPVHAVDQRVGFEKEHGFDVVGQKAEVIHQVVEVVFGQDDWSLSRGSEDRLSPGFLSEE